MSGENLNELDDFLPLGIETAPGEGMPIGPYTFEEFKEKAQEFHGYPAPGLLLGGYMVALAQSRIPEGTLFEAVCETPKCLPDAVQLLTPCSTGNGWLRIVHLGRYAVSLYDKFTGEGVRVWVDARKLARFPEIQSWLMKTKSKKQQNTERLFAEIKMAGHRVCSLTPVRMSPWMMGKKSTGKSGSAPNVESPIRWGTAPSAGAAGARPPMPNRNAIRSSPTPNHP